MLVSGAAGFCYGSLVRRPVFKQLDRTQLRITRVALILLFALLATSLLFGMSSKVGKARKTDGRNVQSQRAIAKLGARYEGTLRRHRILPDGFIRDTVYFSIVPEEWPEVKAGLLTRLGREARESANAVRVRAATAADVEQVLPMVEAICAMHKTMDSTKYGFVEEIVERYRGWLPQRARDARSVFLVAEDGSGVGSVVGFLVGTVEPEIPVYEVKEFGFIHDVWVETRMRRRGVGRLLALAALERFRAMGVPQVRLDTATANEGARRLFAGCGFRASATEMIAVVER